MNEQTFKLSGLTCPACKKLTEKRINSLPGVTKVEVSVESGQATIESDQPVTVLAINDALKDTPYQVII